MEHTCKTFVPLVAEIEITTTNWAEKHEEEEEEEEIIVEVKANE